MSEFLNKHKFLIGGLALGVVGAGVYVYKTQFASDFNNPYPKDLVLLVLRDFKREFQRVYSVLLQQVTRIKTAMRSSGRANIPGASEELMALLVDQNEEFQLKVKEIEDHVFGKHKIADRKRFEKSCEVTYKLDPEVSALLKYMSTSLEEALEGVAPKNETALHASMTAAVTLEILEKTSKAYVCAVLDLAETHLKKGEKISIANLGFVRDLRDVHIETMKQKALADHGMDKVSSEPEEMLNKAVEVYGSADTDGFRQKIGQIENTTKLIMQSVYNGSLDLGQVEKFRVVFNKPKAPAITQGITEAPENEETEQGTTANPSKTLRVSDIDQKPEDALPAEPSVPEQPAPAVQSEEPELPATTEAPAQTPPEDQPQTTEPTTEATQPPAEAIHTDDAALPTAEN